MAGNPDAHDGSVGLDLVLVASRDPDVGGLQDRRGLRDHHGGGLRDNDRRGSDYDGSRSDYNRLGGDGIVDQAADHAADHAADKSAAVVMAMVMGVVMVVVVGTMAPVRTGKTHPGAQNRHNRYHHCFVLLHVTPFLSPPFGVTLC
jgi:hypothetical protein